MRVLSLQPEPLSAIPHQTAGTGGGGEIAYLPVFRAIVDRLPSGLGALVCASDLQGVEPNWQARGAPRLLGEVVAEELATMAELGMLPPAEQIGALLAGDFYSAPLADERGASGDVRTVWRAFHERFRWVVGVGGNHDRFGRDAREQALFFRDEGVVYLDGAVHGIDGLTIGGVSGIVGNPDKPMRHADAAYRRLLRSALAQTPDLILLHESPAVPEQGLIGSALVRQELEQEAQGLVISGHCHWDTPLVELPGGRQVLNVDARVVVLQAA